MLEVTLIASLLLLALWALCRMLPRDLRVEVLMYAVLAYVGIIGLALRMLMS